MIATPGEILQETHYDPCGWRLEGAYINHAAPDNMYQYNEKENNTDHGLNMLDYGVRWYNPGIGRWGSVDPMASERSWATTFSYVQNNPLTRIDPNGALDDWFSDIYGNIRYNEQLNSLNAISILKKGESYLGPTYSETTSNGINNYREDGSIVFGSQADGVAYMVWATTKNGDSGGNQREQFSFINGNSMLVTPDLDNDASTSRPEKGGYLIGDGFHYDPVEKKYKEFNATAHTHSIGSYPSGEGYDIGDLDFQFNKHRSKPGFVIGATDGKISMFMGNGIYQPLDHTGKVKLTVEGIKLGLQKFPNYERIK